MIYDFGVEDELAEMVSAISQRNRLNLTGTSAKEEELSFDLSLIKFKVSCTDFVCFSLHVVVEFNQFVWLLPFDLIIYRLG